MNFGEGETLRFYISMAYYHTYNQVNWCNKQCEKLDSLLFGYNKVNDSLVPIKITKYFPSPDLLRHTFFNKIDIFVVGELQFLRENRSDFLFVEKKSSRPNSLIIFSKTVEKYIYLLLMILFILHKLACFLVYHNIEINKNPQLPDLIFLKIFY